MAEGTTEWVGQSGRTYTYRIYPLPPRFKAVAGNYILARRNTAGGWVPIYIGETQNLAERFDLTLDMPCIRQHRATHILAHRNEAGMAARRSEQKDLIARWDPPCNDWTGTTGIFPRGAGRLLAITR